MSSKDSPNLNRKLTGSFSSPEFDQSLTANGSDSSHIVSSSEYANNGLTVSFTSSNSSQTIKTFTATGIKLNTTRDSGFSDSIIEDNSQTTTSSSVRTFYSPIHTSINETDSGNTVARTEHLFNITNPTQKGSDVTMSTKCYANKGMSIYFLENCPLN